MKLKTALLFVVLVVQFLNHVQAQNKSIEPRDSSKIYEKFLDLAIEGDSLKIDSMIQLGVKTDSAIFDGITPLMFAVQEGHLPVVQLLLKNGANVNAVPENKITPLLGALYANHSEIAETLIESGAEIEVKDDSGMTPFLLAVQNNDTIISNLLFDAGAEIFESNNDKVTALHFAATNGNTEVAELLLFNDFNIDQQDEFGFTALMIAEEFDQRDFAFYLISKGANLNLTNKYGQSVLALAILNGNAYFTELLLLNGANPHPPEKLAKDYHYHAKIIGNDDIKQLLKSYHSKRNLKPVFDKFQFGVPSHVMDKNWWTGLSLGLHETKYNYTLETSFLFNPFLHRSLSEINGITYSFWRREFRVQAKLEKHIAFNYFNRKSYGLFLGAAPAYTFGTYRATSYTPDDYFSLSPVFGAYYSTGNFEVKAGYEYLIRSGKNFSGILFSMNFLFNASK